MNYSLSEIYKTYNNKSAIEQTLAMFMKSDLYFKSISLGLRKVINKKFKTKKLLYITPELIANSQLPESEQKSAVQLFQFLPVVINHDDSHALKLAQQRSGIMAEVEKKPYKLEQYPIMKLYNKLAETDDIYFIESALEPNQTQTPNSFPYPKLTVTFDSEKATFDVVTHRGRHMRSVEDELDTALNTFIEQQGFAKTNDENE